MLQNPRSAPARQWLYFMFTFKNENRRCQEKEGKQQIIQSTEIYEKQ